MQQNIYIISDSIGETANQVLNACLAQFPTLDTDIRRFSQVSTLENLEKILNSAMQERAMVVYTLVDKQLLHFLEDYVRKHDISSANILGSTLKAVSKATGLKATGEAGSIRKLNQKYFNRVSAIEFAVKYDDGKDPRGLLKADLVLLGISRTSKTPLSMYLANRGVCVANVPLVPESTPPKQIYEVSRRRIVGLTNEPEQLNQIRTERLKALGLPSGANYSNLSRILEELEFAEGIMKKIGCPIINVANKAIEETAELVMQILNRNGVKILSE